MHFPASISCKKANPSRGLPFAWWIQPYKRLFIAIQVVVVIVNNNGTTFDTISLLPTLNIRFDDLFIEKATRSSHSSYRPLSNPLTAHDDGLTTEIDIAPFQMASGSSIANLSLGAVLLLGYNTLYYVWYDDPGFVGGAVTYQASLVKETALIGENRYFVGSIITPVAGGPDTKGNGDGGSGAQSGQVFRLNMSLSTGSGVVGNGQLLNPENAIDGDPTTYCTLRADGNGSTNSASLIVSAPPGWSSRLTGSDSFSNQEAQKARL